MLKKFDFENPLLGVKAAGRSPAYTDKFTSSQPSATAAPNILYTSDLFSQAFCKICTMFIFNNQQLTTNNQQLTANNF